jgi:benzoyl-CoA reductase/2-hydroxyglutaryl-CoA dehydratase subunit BcrC/BadD/HgdB
VEKKVDYCPMWERLGMDIEAHQQLMNALPSMFQEAILDQPNRPQGMDYFDLAMMEIHGARIQEIMNHKEAGGKVIGTFCLYVPEEVVLAAGGIMVGLCGGAEVGIAEAELLLPRNLCPLIKSSLGFKLSRMCPYLQSADLVVGETTCDGKKKMYEILRDMAPVYVMELPQTKSPPAKELWFEEVKRFKVEVEKLTGNQIDERSLGEAIKFTNRRRTILQRLNETRKANPAPISSRDALLVSMIAFFDDYNRFSEKASVLCEELETRAARREGVADPSTPRLMISGTPMAVPNWKLPHLIETSGGIVVCEEACTGQRLFRELINESNSNVEAQLRAISQRSLKYDCACFTPNDERIENVVKLAKEYNVNGVIYGALQNCQTYSVEFYRVEQALRRINVPMYKVEYDYGTGDVGQLKTRIEAFIEMISK